MFKSQVTSPCPIEGKVKKKKHNVKITLQDRLEALDLLAEGETLTQVVKAMAKKHPTLTLDEVRVLYDPQGGYSIRKLEGATKAEVGDKKTRLIALNAAVISRGTKSLAKLEADPKYRKRRAKAARNRLLKLHKDPEFAAARDKRAKEQIVRLNANPEFRSAASARLTKLHKDPEFAAARDARGKASFKKLWKNPKFRKARTDDMKTRWQNDEYRRDRITRAKQQFDDPQFLKNFWAGHYQYWTPEKRREQMALAKLSPKYLKNLRKGYKRYWTPEQRKEQSRVMLERRYDPEFVAAMEIGYGRWVSTYRQEKLEALADMGIHVISKGRTGWIQVGNIWAPDRIAMSREKSEAIADALSSLDPFERQVVDLVILADQAAPLTTAETAVELGASEEEIELILKGALSRLASNRQLQEIA